MSRQYAEHEVMRQIQDLLGQEKLHDCTLHFKLNDNKVKTSAFVMSLCSPVLRTMFCGDFMEGSSKEATIEDLSSDAFEQAVDLWLGKEICTTSLEKLVAVGDAADRFGMRNVCEQVQSVVLQTIGSDAKQCVEVLNYCENVLLDHVEDWARHTVMDTFHELCTSDKLCDASESVMAALFESDDLCIDKEEDLLELLARWQQCQQDELEGADLVGKVRFGLMDREYLESKACEGFSGAMRGIVEDHVREALSVLSLLDRGCSVDFSNLPLLRAINFTRRGG
eukprot:CAMPEP_0113698282 /NCGR_PEP_ID=MMETSP0038_2-20120614/22617_1 /TAXON_ID=2898 /ORGANISM="Cryptomonas paramecium" /LENGTH=280 /DNA_ID=CAMNT_0000621415 /DNA_START=32 /DNA_END=870 /DNA_ORIENTATION=- /assembly_acc=CAM_ASM_000170